METRTEIGSLGEFGLIDHLTRNIELKNVSSIVGVGDDGAVIDHFGRQTVISTDLPSGASLYAATWPTFNCRK